MVAVTYLPLFVTVLFRGMPGIWQGRHRLMLCWLGCMQALFPGHKTLEELARWTPAQVTAWRFRRVLKASYWNVHLLVEWWGQEALNTLPPPKDGDIHLVGDGSDKPKRGLQNPLAQKGRKSEHHPWFFGIRFALLIVHWDSYRLPVAFRLIRPKGHPEYQPENALFREMVGRFVPPPWAKRVIVEGDAAYGSHENIKMVQQRDADDATRRWGLVFAIARTWKTVEDKAIKDLVTHLPRIYYQRTRVPRLPGAQGCKTFWVYSTRLCLRHIGDVTVVLSKRGRNLGPKQTKILVTNLAEWTRRQVVGAYPRRGPVEQINRELKTDLGLGAHQVSREEGRIEKSFGIAVLAYLLLIRACHQEILPGTSWSIAQLQHAFRLRVITNQVEHNVKTRLAKARKAA
jgi:Transposase DDE domain